MKKIIFRLDDICPDMDYTKFRRIRDLFLKYGIKPLIGIIPDNHDEKLKAYRERGEYVDDKQIWRELRELTEEKRWEVALHGFRHLYDCTDGGLLKRNKQSEFAGHSKEDQSHRIAEGKRILKEQGFTPIAFMAPSHSIDRNTLSALKENNLPIVTDGDGVYPYEMDGVLFMPVPESSRFFWNLPCGIYTICLHPNTMKEKHFVLLEEFIKKHIRQVIMFSDGTTVYRVAGNKVGNQIAGIYMKCLSGMIQLLNKGVK